MPNYQYTALDHKGESTTGVVDAANETAAWEMIKSQGLYPTEIAATSGRAKAPKKAKVKGAKGAVGKVGGAVPSKVMMIFTRQLATLIDAGLPLLQGLTVLGKQEPNPNLKATISSLSDSVQSGATFSESLAQHPKMFNKLFVNMVKAGELGGVLEIVLKRLAEYQEKAQKLKSKIVSAMVYPCIILFIAVAILIFLMLVIVPKFKEMFKDNGTELPAISEFVFNLSDWFFAAPLFVPNIVIILVIVGGVMAAYGAMARTEAGRMKIDAIKLKTPLVGAVLSRSSVARFTRTLGTLVTSGVPILQALQITRDTSGNAVIADAVGKVHDAVKEGESIVSPMNASKVFPPMVMSMVDVGEETGQLPDMLLKVAEVYDDEVDTAVGALTSMLEPIMIVFLAVVVGGIVFAMFLPLLQVIENMG